MLLPYKYFENSKCTLSCNKKLDMSLFFDRKVITFFQLDWVLNKYISRMIVDIICWALILCDNRALQTFMCSITQFPGRRPRSEHIIWRLHRTKKRVRGWTMCLWVFFICFPALKYNTVSTLNWAVISAHSVRAT